MIQLCLMFPQMMFDRKGRLISLKHVRSVPLSSSFSSRRSPAHRGYEEADESEGNAIKWSVQVIVPLLSRCDGSLQTGMTADTFLTDSAECNSGCCDRSSFVKEQQQIKKSSMEKFKHRPPSTPPDCRSVSAWSEKRSRTNSCVLILWFYWSRTRCWNTVHPSRESEILWIKHRDRTR